jgi:hypothetical protein
MIIKVSESGYTPLSKQLEKLINIDVNSNNFRVLSNLDRLHASLYYNGYVYISAVNSWVSAESNYNFVKINVNDYSDAVFTKFCYGYEGDKRQIIDFASFEKAGDYLYMLGWASISSINHIGDVIGVGDGESLTIGSGYLDPNVKTFSLWVWSGDMMMNSMFDNGDGTLSGIGGSGTINYITGELHLIWNSAPEEEAEVLAQYDGPSVDNPNYLLQYDLRDDSYKAFTIPCVIEGNDILCAADIIVSDETYLYVFSHSAHAGNDPPVVGYIFKYLINDFTNPSWSKFNTDYGTAGVPITPVATFDVYSVGSLWKGASHSYQQDATYMYVLFNGGRAVAVRNSSLMKINKSTLSCSENDCITIPGCSDDTASTATHMFLGVEVWDSTDYGYGLSVLAIRKSDLRMTVLPVESTALVHDYNPDEWHYYASDGVFIVNGDLYDVRTDGKIYVLDMSNPDSWPQIDDNWNTPNFIDPYLKRIISFHYSDEVIHSSVVNELVVDNDGYFNCGATDWNNNEYSEIIKFKL